MTHICSDPTKTITVVRSSTFVRTLNFTYEGNPLDITGATVTFGVKKNPSDTSFIIQETAVLTDPSNGVAVITIASATTDISAKKYYYDIKLLEASGRVTLPPSQLFIIEQGVQS